MSTIAEKQKLKIAIAEAKKREAHLKSILSEAPQPKRMVIEVELGVNDIKQIVHKAKLMGIV